MKIRKQQQQIKFGKFSTFLQALGQLLGKGV